MVTGEPIYYTIWFYCKPSLRLSICCWIALSPQNKIHHFMIALYYLYVYVTGSSLTTDFLGITAAGLSVQVIEFLYTFNYLRIRYRFRLLGFCTICIQLLYRWPLVVVSCYCTVQYFGDCPWIHLSMCGALLMLDMLALDQEGIQLTQLAAEAAPHE